MLSALPLLVSLAAPVSISPAAPATPRSSAQEAATSATVFDLGHNDHGMDSSEEWVAFVVPESFPGESDWNGDGDRNDAALHSASALTGAAANHSLAVWDVIEVEGPFVAFAVDESDQAGSDRNGDGDVLDRVMHVLDMRTSTITNLALAIHDGAFFALGREFLVFNVKEEHQGGADLNGDGDAADAVLHVLDLETMQVRSLAIASGAFLENGRMLAFAVPESLHGHTDLNGDGDAIDGVLHVADMASGTITNLGYAVSSTRFEIEDSILVFAASESAQGVDWNGDGDTFDTVLHFQALPNGPVTNLGVAASEFVHGRNHFACRVREGDQRAQDLNGDGDALDLVLFAGSFAGPDVRNLGLAVEDMEIGNARVAFRVRESSQGDDLNGDGDTSDRVAHVHDLNRKLTKNLRLAAEGLLPTWPELVVRVSEPGQGQDLNGDGDTTDVVLGVYDVAASALTTLGIAVTGGPTPLAGPAHANGRLAFLRSELGENRDLNGDGDAIDAVANVLDLESRSVLNLRRASLQSAGAVQLRGDTLVFRLSEASQGGMDRNADGDANDNLLHVARLSK